MGCIANSDPAIVSIGLISLSSGLYAKKKPHTASPRTTSAPAPQMTADQAIIHALNRLTFGPRAEDVADVKRIGLDRWIEQQLHPETIPQNPVLEAKLAPLETLRMSMMEMAERYPTPQMVKLMLDGKVPFPKDVEARYAVNKLIARNERKESADRQGRAGDADLNAKAIPESWQVDDSARQVLEHR